MKGSNFNDFWKELFANLETTNRVDMFEMLDLNRMLDDDMKSQAAIIDEYKKTIK